MLPKTHWTLHSRISGSRWVIIPSWLSGSWRYFLYSSSVYSCHLFLISCSALSPLIPLFLGGGFHQWVSYTQCLSYRESDLRLGDCQLGRHQFGFPRADLAPDHFLGVCSGQTSWTVFSQELMGQNWSFYLDIHLSLHLHGHWILALIPPPRGAEPEK